MANSSNQITADIKSKLIWACIGTIALVVGIPLIIVGATKGLWPVLTLGIICVVFGFYGSPMLWISYGECRALKRVVDAVMEENLTSVAEISQHLVLSEDVTKQQITKAINKKYIKGYIFDGETLKTNDKQAPKKKMVQKDKCKNCGGTLTETDEGWVCEYCGSVFHKD